MSTPDGGPAFPLVASTGDPRDGVYCREGISIRDYFAAAAIRAVEARIGVYDPEVIAVRSYALADAMLAERAKNGGAK